MIIIMNVFKVTKNGEIRELSNMQVQSIIAGITYDYALTYNICANEYINRKKWKSYDQDVQDNILHKKLMAFCRIQDLALEEFTFETCPKTGQRHVHARVVSVLPVTDERIQEYNKKYNACGYQTLFLVPIFDEEGWNKYLNKDQDKS